MSPDQPLINNKTFFRHSNPLSIQTQKNRDVISYKRHLQTCFMWNLFHHPRSPSPTHDSTEFEFLVDSSLILPIKTVDGKSSMNTIKEYTSYDECEGDALLAVEAGLQEMFARTVLQSPSSYSLRLGVLFAAKLKWYDALRTFLAKIPHSPLPDPDI